jgi:ZIP family zinc transporter
MVFFFRKQMSASLNRIFLGFAAGVMIAASVWSLVIPAFDEAPAGWPGIGIVTLGFALGCAGMLALDLILPHQHMDNSPAEGRPNRMSKPMLLVMAVMIHNIPEGIALGVVIEAAFRGGMSWAMALAFGLGLALQNFPEGMAAVFPMRQLGVSQRTCARWGIVASFAEPAAALIGWGASNLLNRAGPVIMPILLGIAAGAMVFIVVEELIPESQCSADSHMPTYGFILGFWAMAVMGIYAG